MYYEVKLQHTKIDETTGKEKTVKEPYLIDAVSFTEGESRMTQESESIVSGEFDITDMKRSKIEEIHKYEEDGYYFKFVIQFIDVDESTGKEKKSSHEVLINAENIDLAKERVNEQFAKVIIPWKIKQVSETKIVDVFEYSEAENSDD